MKYIQAERLVKKQKKRLFPSSLLIRLRTGNRTTAKYHEVDGGFTLIEILVAVAIFGLIFSYVLTVLTFNISATREAQKKMDVEHIGRFIIKRMRHDLSNATLLYFSQRGRFLGRSRERDGFSRDEAHFTTFTRLYYGQGRPLTDQSEVGYYFLVPEEGPEVLMRREAEVIEDRVDIGGVSFEITDMVKELRIRYFDNKNDGWVDAWNSEDSKKLPKYVSVELILNNGARDFMFSAVVRPSI